MKFFFAVLAVLVCSSLSLPPPGDGNKQPVSKEGTEDDISFYLWTRSNSAIYYTLEAFDTASVQNSNFNPSAFTYVLFHGYSSNGLTDWVVNAKTELLAYCDCNIISVDYEKLVPPPNYNAAADNIYVTGNFTARFLDWLNSDFGVDFQNVHLGGHSLGAHAAGMTGHYVKMGTVARVTGMDPAGPLFEEQDGEHTISQSSGAYVDIIHTNGGPFVDGNLGLYTSLGHSDFYPNGGYHQSGCPEVGDVAGCSHGRAPKFWVESINTDTPFKSWPCDSYDSYLAGSCTTCDSGCSEMGLNSINGPQGIFYLNTNAESPFSMGENGNAVSKNLH